MEFKYRKDSKSSFIVNGEFKFAINNKEVLVDYKVANSSDWHIFKHEIKEPGMYTLSWIYTKYQEKGVTEWMSAEIEVRNFFYNLIWTYLVHKNHRNGICTEVVH